MIFLHTFVPPAIAFSFGPLTIYWYGIIMAVAMAASIFLAVHLAPQRGVEKERILDLALWLIIGGIIGARLYDAALNISIYIHEPLEIIKIWHGGLAIHGALIGGLCALILYARRLRQDAWMLAAIIVPAVALGQAIGRWGNWFNQELFGLPTNAPWGIPIVPFNRPLGFESSQYFHPTFLYESIGNLAICIILYFLLQKKIAAPKIIGWYAILYGCLRFALEYIKIDPTPVLFGWRWPQIVSLILIIIGLITLRKKS